jgi:Xaa-Pro aminopeptidase
MTDIVDSLITNSGKKLANNTAMLMRTLRHRKTAEEIALIQKAVDISCDAHNEVMKAAKPGMTEYQVQAIMEYGFKKHGSEYPGYPSINGSADNACVLHYVTNQRLMKDGDLLLSDCAAEYHGYTADITRTIPINGKFTPEQKIIYELVLEAADSAILECRPGIPFRQPHMVANRVIARGLVKLGIIKNESEVRKYFPHGTSHHLGLDVHDQGLQTLDEGVVLTVEPGIYIPSGSDCDKKWWSIGVRIEDDIVITKDGRRNMSTASPRTVAEVEKMMKAKSRFD